MKCLVTGATGFIGRALCRGLREDGHAIVPLSRSGSALADGTPTQALDVARDEFQPGLFDAVDAVIHCGAIAHLNGEPEDYRTVNFDGTVRLYRAACAAGVPTFIFVSSVKAMGPPASAEPGTRPRTESDVYPAPDPYGHWKREAEKALAAHSDACTSLLIIRPTLVYGLENKGNLRLLARGVRLGLPRPPALGLRSMIALPDMARLLRTLVANPPAGCHTFIASGPAVYSTRQIYDLLRKASGRGPGRAWWPLWLWRLAARVLDVVRRRDAGVTWSTMFGDEVYDGSAVTRITGWQPSVQLEDVLSGGGEGAST